MQGVGGSFKNGKPVGEIGCCQSLRAEQKKALIDRIAQLTNWLTDGQTVELMN